VDSFVEGMHLTAIVQEPPSFPSIAPHSVNCSIHNKVKNIKKTEYSLMTHCIQAYYAVYECQCQCQCQKWIYI